MTEFLSIVLLIFSILQIILFFKIWGMTNNVKNITRRMEFPYNKEESLYTEFYSKFLFLLYNKGKEQAREYLYEVMWHSKDMERMIRCKSVESFEENYTSLKKEYNSWFEKLGEEFPSFENIKQEKSK